MEKLNSKHVRVVNTGAGEFIDKIEISIEGFRFWVELPQSVEREKLRGWVMSSIPNDEIIYQGTWSRTNNNGYVEKNISSFVTKSEIEELDRTCPYGRETFHATRALVLQNGQFELVDFTKTPRKDLAL